jgi:nitrogen fixation NifU-like protein
MNDLVDLYQQVIVDHNRNPRNFRPMEDATRTAEGDNPLCGDRITLFVKVDGDTVADVSFQGKGCAISQASASLMTGAVKGKSVTEAEKMFRSFQAMVMGQGQPDIPALGKLAAFGGVKQFPARVKCANLAWHTLHAALTAQDIPVSTE